MAAANSHHKYHYFIFIPLSLLLFLFSPFTFINKILAAAACVGVVFNLGNIQFKFKRWYHAALFLGVSAYLTFAFFGYDLFLLNISDRISHFTRFIYMALGFAWVIYLLQSTLDGMNALSNYVRTHASASIDHYWSKWLLLFAVLIAIFSVWLWAYNPIVLSPDSWDYLDGWLNSKYLAIHSPVYTYLVNIICTLAPTKPEVMWIAVAQILCFSALLSTILMYFHKRWIPYKFVLPFAVILPLIPSLGQHAIVVWSDLPCAMSILWLTYALVRILDEIIIHDTADKRQIISLAVQLTISLVLVYYLRANSFLVFLVMVPILIVLSILKKKWSLLLTAAISVLLVLLIRFPGYKALRVTYSSASDEHKFYAGMHDMQAAYYYGDSLSEKTVSALRKHILKLDDPEGNVRFQPDKVLYYSQYFDYDLSGLSTGEFIAMYLDSLVRDPIRIFRSMLSRTRAYWVIDPKQDISFVNFSAIFDPETNKYQAEAPSIGVYRKNVFIEQLVGHYRKEMNTPLLATFIWRFGIWTALMIISSLYLFNERHFMWLLAYVPIAVYLMTIYLTVGWLDYRYGLPVFLVGMFLPAVTIMITAGKPNQETTKHVRPK